MLEVEVSVPGSKTLNRFVFKGHQDQNHRWNVEGCGKECGKRYYRDKDLNLFPSVYFYFHILLSIQETLNYNL